MKAFSFRPPPNLALTFAAALGAATVATSASAATYTWTGGGSDGNWTTTANWLSGTSPVSDVNTSIIFDGASQLNSNQNINNGSIFLNSLVFNSGAGAFTLSGGRLDFTSSGANALPTLTQSSAALITINNNLRINNAFTVGGAGNLTLGGAIDSNGSSITMAGAGTLTLTGNSNNFNSPVTLQAGTLNVGSANALGGRGNNNAIAFTGGTLQYSASNQLDYSTRFSQAANQVYRFDTNGQSVTFAAGLTSSGGSLTKLGAGTLTLSGANTYTGTTTVSGGTLSFAGTSGLTNGGALTVNAGATLAVGGTANVSLASTSALRIDGAAGVAANGTLSGGTLTTGATYIGDQTNGVGVFTQTGGTHNLNGGSLVLGYGAATSSGTYNLSGSASQLTSGLAYIGYNGTGVVNQTDGTNTANTELYVGLNAGSNGTYNQSGGTMNAGTQYITVLGRRAGAQGTYNLSGTGVFSSGATLVVGYEGTGAFNQTGGTSTFGGNGLFLGYNAGSTGTYTLSGGTATMGQALVGFGGTGTATQTGGAFTVNSNALFVGYNAGISGTYNLGGGTLISTSSLVGYSGAGTFNQTGGNHTVNSDQLYIGYGTGSTGIYNLSSGTLTTPSIDVGDSGTAFFNQTGGFANVTTTLDIGYNGDGAGTYTLGGGLLRVSTGVLGYAGASTFNFAGGTLQAAAATTTFMQGLTTANVQAGGAQIDTNGNNVTISQALLHNTSANALPTDGGLIKSGNGTLTLTGTNTFNGAVTINAGTLSVAGETNLGTGSNVTVNGGGQLAFTGNATLTRTYNLGVSTVSAAVGQTLTFGSGSVVNGGFLSGPGTDVLGNGALLNAVTARVGSTLTQASGSTATLNNSTLQGSITQAGGTLALSYSTGTTSSRVTVGGTVNATGSELDGTTTVNSGGRLATSGSSLYLGAGGRTTINSGGTLAAASGTSVELNGALLVNNGTQSGNLNVNFGSVAKGTGTFGNVTVGDGGQFGTNSVGGNGGSDTSRTAAFPAANHVWLLNTKDALMGPVLSAAPGTTNVTSLTLGSGSIFAVRVQDATGAPGTGYDLTHATQTLTLNGDATPGNQIVIRLGSLNANGAAGPAIDFDPSQNYRFILVQSDGGITGYTPGEFAVDTGNFQNATNGGSFAVDRNGNQLLLTFTAVPEPSTWALLGVGTLSLGSVALRRRRVLA